MRYNTYSSNQHLTPCVLQSHISGLSQPLTKSLASTIPKAFPQTMKQAQATVLYATKSFVRSAITKLWCESQPLRWARFANLAAPHTPP